MCKYFKILLFLIPLYFIQGCGDGISTSDDIKIKLNGSEYVKLRIGEKFKDPGAEAYSKIDGNITDKIIIKSKLNIYKEGNYTITYSATDSSFNSAIAIRQIEVKSTTNNKLEKLIPIDSNIDEGNENGVLYYADPRKEENGLNRVVRIDYNKWTYTEMPVVGNNPHSIDRAGNSDKFYVRTQNSNSFDVVNFKKLTLKTIPLGDHKPRAIGAFNAKYNIQLLSAKNMPMVDVIDVTNDKIIGSLGYKSIYKSSEITSNGGSGSATGHALWFDVDHLGVIDRLHKKILVYEIKKDKNGHIIFKNTTILSTLTALHAIERDIYPKNEKDKITFYGMGEGDLSKHIAPYIVEFNFDPKSGILRKTGRVAILNQSNKKINNISPAAHHGEVTPDGKYFVAPILDGKIYIINRSTMKIDKIIPASLGAAHIVSSKSRSLSIVTNHYSNYITIFNYKTLKKVKDLRIGFIQKFNPEHKHLLQPHFSYVSKDGKYFFTFATQEGKFLKIDLDTLEIVDTLEVGGAPEQAHS